MKRILSGSILILFLIANSHAGTGESSGPRQQGKLIQPPRYEVIDLGDFGGELANANAINDLGHVVGTAERAGDNLNLPFLWRDGEMMHLGSLFPDLEEAGGRGRAISLNGFIAGEAAAPYPGNPKWSVGHAFFWTEEDGMIDLAPDSTAASSAWGVNSSGQVVGTIGGPSGGAFIWSEETGFEVIELPWALFTSNMAEDINEAGLVVGHAWNTDSEVAGWVYDSASGDIWALPHLESAPTETRAINDAGDIVGASRLANNQGRPVMWTHDGEIIDLGFLPIPNYSQGIANDINEYRWIIGADSYDGSGVPNKGWLWLEEEKHELLSLIDDPDQRELWDELSTPLGINNLGEIVGIGIREGIPGRAFLMRPLEESACHWNTAVGNPGGPVHAMGLWRHHIYLGGTAAGSFNDVAGGLVRIDSIDYSAHGLGTAELVDGEVTDFAAFNPGPPGTLGQLFITGTFSGVRVGGEQLPGSRAVVAWDGETVTALPDLPFVTSSAAAHTTTVFDGRLVIGGAEGVGEASRKPLLSLWDGSEWITYREQFEGEQAPAILTAAVFNGALYFGGRFDRIVLTDGGEPGPNEIFSDRFQPTPLQSTAGEDDVIESANIMGFDGQNFFSVGGGLKSENGALAQVLAMEVFDDGNGPALYIGGRFDMAADGKPAFAVAKWDGHELTAVGAGFPAPYEVRDLTVFDAGEGDGPFLHAVGSYTEDALGQPMRGIARLRDAQWEEVAGGIGGGGDAPIPGSALSPVIGHLAVGGTFTEVGDGSFPGSGAANGFAILDCHGFGIPIVADR